ncbi:hypothetical protein PM082_013287 [Marasmius tenuissimus]|nr:hypothetical protein PM082_013287 [Marasmius tenuissimus]
MAPTDQLAPRWSDYERETPMIVIGGGILSRSSRGLPYPECSDPLAPKTPSSQSWMASTLIVDMNLFFSSATKVKKRSTIILYLGHQDLGEGAVGRKFSGLRIVKCSGQPILDPRFRFRLRKKSASLKIHSNVQS